MPKVFHACHVPLPRLLLAGMATTMLTLCAMQDVLIQNSDRHAGHFLLAPHWSRGNYREQSGHDGRPSIRWHGEQLPVLIDQAAGFRSDAFVSLEHENAFGTGPCLVVSARTYMRLRFLTRKDICNALDSYISSAEIDALMHRRDQVLDYFDTLVAKKGYSAVVIEDNSVVSPAQR
eukprot:365942-Chlamydomonas_euryale.AAC.61